MIIHFNTGRFYNDYGQRMSAIRDASGTVFFYDHARGMDGQFPSRYPGFIPTQVMEAYDRGFYESTVASREFGNTVVWDGDDKPLRI